MLGQLRLPCKLACRGTVSLNGLPCTVAHNLATLTYLLVLINIIGVSSCLTRTPLDPPLVAIATVLDYTDAFALVEKLDFVVYAELWFTMLEVSRFLQSLAYRELVVYLSCSVNV